MSVYLLRGAAVALSEFLLTYLAIWLAVTGGWSRWAKGTQRIARTPAANVLYALQLAPFLLAASLTLLFALPAFLRFEPHRAEEEFGWPIVLFGLLCLAFLATGLWRAARAIMQTRRMVRLWNGRTVSTASSAGVPVMETASDAPPLVVAGLLRPRLYVSSSAAEVLSEHELARAIAHESAHVRRHDNLKKLLLRLCCLPVAGALERRWIAAAEMAADMDAVRSRREALDLASALVKASKMATPSPDLAMTFTADGTDLLRARVERLLSWNGDDVASSHWTVICAAISFVAVAFLLTPWYSTLLLAVHEFSEILVR